eukprot:6106652-Pyramimonas_sp.AAC.1
MPDRHVDAVERRLQQERLRLVRERRAYRAEAADVFAIYGHYHSYDDTRLDCLKQIRRISNQLRRWARRRRALHRERLYRELRHARAAGQQAEVHKLARLLSGRSTGAKNRRYNTITSCRPTLP